MLTPADAARIAAAHDLTVTDAAGLAQLADTVEEAEAIAAQFAATDAAFRAHVRKMFAPPEPSPLERTLRRHTQES